MSIPLRPSTPIKKGFPPVETRRAVDACNDLRDQKLLQDVGTAFIEAYLSNTTSATWSVEEQVWVSQIKKVRKGKEESLYTEDAPLLCLLNSISKRIFESPGGGGGTALVFHSGDKTKIQNPLNGQVRTPDIIALREMTQVFPTINYFTDRPPETTWCVPVAVGEVKVKKQAQHQLAGYLQLHLQFHPELDAVLGFSARSSGYALFYHDAAVIHQAEFKWKEATALYAFVETLYTRPFRDTSMQVLDSPEGPAWATKIGNEVYLSKMPRGLAGPGQRRYTVAAINLTSNEKVFIKDIWRDERRKFFEALLLAQAHEGQTLSGLMLPHHDCHGYVLNETGKPIRTTHLDPKSVNGQVSGRYKMRMMTKDIGRPLKDVHRLRQFLCVMYDACAVQRNLYRKQILHRDISDENIMLAPDTDEYRERCAKGNAEVKFVNQVLAKGQKCDPKPACLVIDLGNGADLKESRDGGIPTERTGTPKFIARSVGSQKVLDKVDFESTGVNMPPPGDYGQFMHSTPYPDTDSFRSIIDPASKFTHQLFHDAESTFWVIAWTLARSTATEHREEPKPDPNFSRFYHSMQNHFPVPGDEGSDLRTNFRRGSDYWKSILHPDLKSMTAMMTEMFSYIKPEWAHLPQLDPEHAHEALMRLLLAEIVRIDENKADIPLFVGARPIPRPPPDMRVNMTSLSLSLAQRSKPARTTPDGAGPSEKLADSQPQTPSHSQPPQHETGSNARAEEALKEFADLVKLKAQGNLLNWQGAVCELQPPESRASGEKV
ncbi:unnamed protein product [Rhizoctonia solani]|uniref:Fungal-type protein kinase domain-containing protein n=1 Tax=Rhizoctonia solani TaxID=456999 RepID=A0A8H2Y2F0_9AGAM|nr:unnamed protein product [Rhizoctonia solani]